MVDIQESLDDYARTTDTRLYGLGACDMKGPLASTLVASLSYHSIGASKPLTLIYTCDEENGKTGARKIVKDSMLMASTQVEYAIIAEPTELQVVHAHKADITFDSEGLLIKDSFSTISFDKQPTVL